MTELTSPRAKKRVYQSEEAPFPVPIETITKKPASDGRWFYYTGHMSTNYVFVKREGDITFLYKMVRIFGGSVYFDGSVYLMGQSI